MESLCGWGGLAADEAALRAALRKALETALAAVEGEAVARSCPVRDLAATLIVVGASPEAVAAAQIGDGAVVLGTDGPEKGYVTLTAPASGEYINETTFVTDAASLDQAHYGVWYGAARGLAVFSDGLQLSSLKMPEAAPHPGFFEPLFRFVAQDRDEETLSAELAAFLSSPKIRNRTDDDVTLVLAGRSPSPPVGEGQR